MAVKPITNKQVVSTTNINRGKQVFILMEVIKENWIEVNPLNHNKDDI